MWHWCHNKENTDDEIIEEVEKFTHQPRLMKFIILF